MDYLTHNVEEHTKFKELMKEIENTDDKAKREELFIELYATLHGHHESEEHVIFPVVMEALTEEEDKNILREMIEEHSLGMYQFSVIHKTGLDNETWDAKFSVLKEVLEHHMEEEEDDFTKMARKALPKERFEELLDPFEEALTKYKEEKLKDLQ